MLGYAEAPAGSTSVGSTTLRLRYPFESRRSGRRLTAAPYSRESEPLRPGFLGARWRSAAGQHSGRVYGQPLPHRRRSGLHHHRINFRVGVTKPTSTAVHRHGDRHDSPWLRVAVDCLPVPSHLAPPTMTSPVLACYLESKQQLSKRPGLMELNIGPRGCSARSRPYSALSRCRLDYIFSDFCQALPIKRCPSMWGKPCSRRVQHQAPMTFH